MAISEKLGNIRQLLPGAATAVDDDRLLQLYWNRAELKKELSRLQDECHALQENLNRQEKATSEAEERLIKLEEYLGNPEAAVHAMAYFQLSSLWRLCANKLAGFALQLQRQQEERERHRQLLEFNQAQRAELAQSDERLAQARAHAENLEGQLKQLEDRLITMRGFWNYFRRRRLAEEIATARGRCNAAVLQLTQMTEERERIANAPVAAFTGISLDGRRTVNTALIAYAQQQVDTLSRYGLSQLIKDASIKQVFDARYGTAKECSALLLRLREAILIMGDESESLSTLKERTDTLRAAAIYRGSRDTVPTTESIGLLPVPASSAGGPAMVNREGINVLIDDYWDLYRVLLR